MMNGKYCQDVARLVTVAEDATAIPSPKGGSARMSSRPMSKRMAATLALCAAILVWAPVTAGVTVAGHEHGAPTTMSPSDIDWP